MAEAEAAGQVCVAAGWASRPTWVDLGNGLRPPQLEADALSLGEWAHGWQYHASNALETTEFEALVVSLALPSTRANAASQCKARMHSCRGAFAASWLTAFPTSSQTSFTDPELNCAMRRRLGLAVAFEGPDPHGHRRLADNLGARLNARHTVLIAAWRQIFAEAGGQVPDRNIERMLSNTHLGASGRHQAFGPCGAWAERCARATLVLRRHYCVTFVSQWPTTWWNQQPGGTFVDRCSSGE